MDGWMLIIQCAELLEMLLLYIGSQQKSSGDASGPVQRGLGSSLVYISLHCLADSLLLSLWV